MEDEDAHGAGRLAVRLPRSRLLRSARCPRQRYRLRAPSTGREILMEAEPGTVYRDRETGEELEVVGKMLPLAAVALAAAVGRGEPAVLQLVRPARPEGPQRLPDLRPPHGRAAPLSALMRHARARIAAARPPSLLALAVAGCGGRRSLAARCPGPPAALTVPAGRAGRSATPLRPQDPRRRPTTAAEHATRRRRPTSSDGDHRRRQRRHRRRPRGRPTHSGGTAAPDADGGRRRRTTRRRRPARTPQQFEDFCAQNPGAC